jgi:hypothetical protein
VVSGLVTGKNSFYRIQMTRFFPTVSLKDGKAEAVTETLLSFLKTGQATDSSMLRSLKLYLNSRFL